MNTIATEDNEKTDIRAKLEGAIEKAKDACERLEEKTVAAAKTADKSRSHASVPSHGNRLWLRPPGWSVGDKEQTRMSPASSIHQSCRFGHDSDTISATSSNCRSGDRFDWEMLAIWVFVAFSFAALVFACYFIWAKFASPSHF